VANLTDIAVGTTPHGTDTLRTFERRARIQAALIEEKLQPLAPAFPRGNQAVPETLRIAHPFGDAVAQKRSEAAKRGHGPKAAAPNSHPNNSAITAREAEDVEERSLPRTPVIYEIVSRHGEDEMSRPVVSLWWSGVAGGMSISFSLLAESILVSRLPDAPWRPLIANFGYSVGFVMVVMARQQLFTETTVTAVLPFMAKPNRDNFSRLLRMWIVVLAANFAGTLFAALFCSFTPVLTNDLYAAMLTVSRQITAHSFWEAFFGAISAGFLMAAMVWLIPSAETAQFYIIVLMTYLIAAGGFPHIVAGSVEAFMLVLHGDATPLSMLGHFVVPVLVGNVVGGTALFALIAYAQVMKEI
jgi:formate/nitrite transporter FocA (FNT family)